MYMQHAEPSYENCMYSIVEVVKILCLEVELIVHSHISFKCIVGILESMLQ